MFVPVVFAVGLLLAQAEPPPTPGPGGRGGLGPMGGLPPVGGISTFGRSTSTGTSAFGGFTGSSGSRSRPPYASSAEIDDLRRRVEALEARQGPGAPAFGPGGPRGFGGGVGFRAAGGPAVNPADSDLSRLTNEIRAKRQELEALEQQLRAAFASRLQQRNAPAPSTSMEERLDRLTQQVQQLRSEVRRERSQRGGR